MTRSAPWSSGPHHRWWREGGVDGEQRPGVVGDAGQGGDVGDTEVGVGDDLGVHEPGVGAYGGAHGVEVGDVDEVDLDAELLREHVGEQSSDAHVDDAGDDGVVAGVEDGEGRGVQRGHAGREHRGGLAVVQPGQLLLQATLVGAVLTRVHQAPVAGVVDVAGVLGQPVGVRHHDGGADGAGGLVGVVAPVDRPRVAGEGVEVVLVGSGAVRQGHAGSSLSVATMRSGTYGPGSKTDWQQITGGPPGRASRRPCGRRTDVGWRRGGRG